MYIYICINLHILISENRMRVVYIINRHCNTNGGVLIMLDTQVQG